MNNTQHTLSAKLTNIFNSLSYEERNDFYQYIRYFHVRKDVESQMMQTPLSDYGITDANDPRIDSIADKAAEAYVYGKRYDCDLSYWDNINNLIDEALDQLED